MNKALVGQLLLILLTVLILIAGSLLLIWANTPPDIFHLLTAASIMLIFSLLNGRAIIIVYRWADSD